MVWCHDIGNTLKPGHGLQLARIAPRWRAVRARAREYRRYLRRLEDAGRVAARTRGARAASAAVDETGGSSRSGRSLATIQSLRALRCVHGPPRRRHHLLRRPRRCARTFLSLLVQHDRSLRPPPRSTPCRSPRRRPRRPCRPRRLMEDPDPARAPPSPGSGADAAPA